MDLSSCDNIKSIVKRDLECLGIGAAAFSVFFPIYVELFPKKHKS